MVTDAGAPKQEDLAQRTAASLDRSEGGAGDFLTCGQDKKRDQMPTLNWHKREEAVRAATRAPYRLLEPVAELSYGDTDSENLLIQGDSLDALKALLPYYAGRVKCIA